MKKLILFFIILAFGFNSEGQSFKLKRANQKFEHLSYVSAIGLYNDLLGSKEESPVMLFKLAMCYYNTNRMQEAADIFSKYLKISISTFLFMSEGRI